eukprot:TRINITY_DN6725_c0_g2_i5.p1 TRINITY_DN6725_c0_g2~~TRINITY_DN6725_c0_g2_i5.p1  ORF type:complete len:598 (+),score=117.62 TRINITY_DN6725_c0_g2_i5:149-1942(+)
MRSHTAYVLSVALLFSTLISFTLGNPQCAILAGQDGSNLTPSGTFAAGARDVVNFNVNQYSKIVPHLIWDSVNSAYYTDYFVFNDEGANVIRKVTFDGLVSTFAGQEGTSGNTDDYGTSAQFDSPRGIIVDSGLAFVADYNNQAIRTIDPAGLVSTFVDGNNVNQVNGVIKPFAVSAPTDQPSGVWILGDNVGSAGQSLMKLDITGAVAAGPSSLFSPGECSGLVQDINSPWNLYVICGSTLKVYDVSLVAQQDINTPYTTIDSVHLDPNGIDTTMIIAADGFVYRFDPSGSTSTLLAGVSGPYDGTSDLYGEYDCTDVSFNNLRSATLSTQGTFIALTSWNVYIEVVDNSNDYANTFAPANGFTGLPNVLTLSFDNYNSLSNELTVVLDLNIEFAAYNVAQDLEFLYTYDVLLKWWEVGTDIAQANTQTITVTSASDLYYVISPISPLTHYYVQAQFKTTSGSYADPTVYEWGIPTQVFSGPSNDGDALIAGSVDGDAESAQYSPTVDKFASDVDNGFIYFADSITYKIVQISLEDGSETTVAGTDSNPGTSDGDGLSAAFLWPEGAVFDPVHRLLYVLDGGDNTPTPANTPRTLR